MERPVLYSYWRSSSSYRVRIVLNLKKVEYDYRAVNLLRLAHGEQAPPEVLAINPAGQVPALVIDGQCLTQSVAICEYLEETRAAPIRLLPVDPARRAQVRRVVEIINSGIQPLQNIAVVNRIGDHCGDQLKEEWPRFWIKKGLAQLEKVVQSFTEDGPYSFGNELSLADAFLVPQMGHAERFGVSISEFPTLCRVYENLRRIPEFIAAHPSRQPDADPSLE
jgi:maleylacetoacetate isomerase